MKLFCPETRNTAIVSMTKNQSLTKRTSLLGDGAIANASASANDNVSIDNKAESKERLYK